VSSRLLDASEASPDLSTSSEASPLRERNEPDFAIDIHSHFTPPECLDALRRLDPSAAPRLEGDAAAGQGFLVSLDQRFGPFGVGMYDIEARMHEHEQRRITIQAISVPPPFFHYTLEPGLAAAFARIINDALLAAVGAYPGRAVALSVLPLQDPTAAVAELERTMQDPACRGIEIGTNINGRDLDEPELEPVWAAAERLGAFIFVHPERVAAADRLGRYYLRNFIGNPLDTTIAIASLVFSGVLARYPRLKLCFAHGGGFAPYQVGRFDHGWGKRSEPRVVIQQAPSVYVRRVYFDSILHNPEALAYVVRKFGADHVLLGSDYPFDMGPDDPVAEVEAISDLTDADRRTILGASAARLLGIQP
jgi:aminocarboxymuconate-semialdehyde decarboxylase